jgi:hypothetical protein
LKEENVFAANLEGTQKLLLEEIIVLLLETKNKENIKYK